MAFVLGGTTIRKPNSMTEDNSTQVAQQRTLSGNVSRDYFGSNKNVFTLKYEHVNYSDWSTINGLYQSYLTNKTTKSFQITDSNYNGAGSTSRNVHIDLLSRDFNSGGTSFLSDFTLILTEA